MYRLIMSTSSHFYEAMAEIRHEQDKKTINGHFQSCTGWKWWNPPLSLQCRHVTPDWTAAVTSEYSYRKRHGHYYWRMYNFSLALTLWHRKQPTLIYRNCWESWVFSHCRKEVWNSVLPIFLQFYAECMSRQARPRVLDRLALCQQFQLAFFFFFWQIITFCLGHLRILFV